MIVNGVLANPLPGDAVAEAFSRQQHETLRPLPDGLAALPVDTVPLAPYDLTGIAALRAFSAHDPPPDKAPVSEGLSDPLPGIDELIAELAQTGPGITMIMGKGGVGKTSIAAAVARGLARAGCATHLASTDPAGHPADDTDGNLTTSWIDPAGETQRYIDAKLDRAKHLDQAARDLLAEDLRSPCTEELAVFTAFSNLIRRGRTEHVVIDTAPTGHTLLLLDQTGSYHHDVMRTSSGVEGRVTTPLMRLQDPGYTRILIVTLAQTTPVQEATELQTDLRRAGIEPYGWIINASLAASNTRDPVLRRRATLEHDQIRLVRDELARVAWIIPWQLDSPGDR